MKYRKKPVVIEAVEWTGKNHREIYNFLEEKPDSYIKTSGRNFYIDHDKVKGGLIIKTLEGEHLASVGDYIIKGVNGEFYPPCKPDVFAKTYDEEEEPLTEEEYNEMVDSMAGVTDVMRGRKS